MICWQHDKSLLTMRVVNNNRSAGVPEGRPNSKKKKKLTVNETKTNLMGAARSGPAGKQNNGVALLKFYSLCSFGE